MINIVSISNTAIINFNGESTITLIPSGDSIKVIYDYKNPIGIKTYTLAITKGKKIIDGIITEKKGLKLS